MNADSGMSQSKDSKSTPEVWGALETDEESTPRCMTVLLNDPGPWKTRLAYILVQVKHGDRKLEGSRRIFLQDENVDQGQVRSAQHRFRKSCSHSTKLGEAQLREAKHMRVHSVPLSVLAPAILTRCDSMIFLYANEKSHW